MILFISRCEKQILASLHKHLGVQFVYEPTSPSVPKSNHFASINLVQTVNLSNEWKERMHHALIEADVIKMQDLIWDIEVSLPDFSKALADMVYHFDYDGVRAMIDPE